VFLLLCVWVGDGVSEKIEHVNIIKGIVHKCPNFLNCANWFRNDNLQQI